MTKDEVRALFTQYYGGVDRADMAAATAVLHPDVAWNHQQVWAHHGFARGSPTVLVGRDAVRAFLDARVEQLRNAGISHHVRELLMDDGRGALLGAVTGPGPDQHFMVWFEIAEHRIARYLLRPI